MTDKMQKDRQLKTVAVAAEQLPDVPIKPANRWQWLPAAMPGVARLMAEKRRAYGAEHVAECWRRGMAGEPGWLFAREGAVAVGTPWAGDPVLENFAMAQVTATQALLVMREPGTHTAVRTQSVQSAQRGE
jgi:hypothetical protein